MMIVLAPPLVEVPSSDGDTEPLVPKYTFVEQGLFDIAEHTTNTNAPAPRRPKQIIVTIYLEKATSDAKINLNASDQLLVIKSDSKPDARYNLEL